MSHARTSRDCLRRAVLIAGPTASGKSGLALALAQELDGIIINADSMQVYRDLRILTARPSADEEARASHRLYGHVDAAQPYSVGHWLRDVEPVLAEAAREARVPILVGGTGLYFKALTGGLAAVPSVPAAVRAGLRERLAVEGAPALHAELAAHDPHSAAKIRPQDAVRITRALEVLQATARPLSEWHLAGMAALLAPCETVSIFLTPDRAELYRRIDARFDAMLAAGALEEVRALVSRKLDPYQPIMRAHGVPRLSEFLADRLPLSEAARQSKSDIRRYAKRQFTWFRHQLPDFTSIADDRASDHILQALGRVRA
jgi:tRNA dimethylallyltransferase